MSAPTPVPHNLDAELAVLSACLIHHDAVATAGTVVRPEDFYKKAHAETFAAMVELHRDGVVVDPLTVADALERRGALALAGGKDFLGFLIDYVPDTFGVKHHAGIVQRESERRALAAKLEEARTAVLTGAGSAKEVAAELSGTLVDVVVRAGRQGFEAIGTGLMDVLTGIEDRGAGRVPPGVATGLRDIDAVIGGFRGGDLIILAGVPGSGKTAAGLNVLLNAARRGDEGAMVSAEMHKRELTERVLGNMAFVDSQTMRSGRLSPEEWERVTRAGGELAKLPLHIDDTPLPTITDICARLRHLKTQHPGLKIAVVDFIQLVRADSEGGRGNIALALTEIAYQLKGLAKELDIPIVATCQVDAAAVEKSEDKRPYLHHLRWSQGMREAADFVALCSRPAMYAGSGDPFAPSALDVMEVYFDKCRGLPVFAVSLKWVGRYMRLEDIPRTVPDQRPRAA